MSGHDDPATRRQELETRNSALRGQIDTMLSDLRRRTQDLQDKQTEAAQKSHEVSSEDGMVTAKVDATGTLQELGLAPKAFERSTPDKLAKSITSVIREATGTAQQALQADFAPLTETPELPDLFAGAPSLQDYLPKPGPLVPPPDPEAERAHRAGDVETPRKPHAPEVDYDQFDEFDDYGDGSRRGFRPGGRS